MASCVKSLRNLSFSHVAIAILAIITGIASMNVTDYYTGVFGMGIWLGGWILITGLSGMASAVKPGNYCRIGVFLGCCLVNIVILSICSIVIGTVVIKHFQFESTVTRDYYKDKGTWIKGQRFHEDYFKPDEYFDNRHKAGRVGLAVYGCLLGVILIDVLLSAASVYVCRDLTLSQGQAAVARNNNQRPSSIRRAQANPGVVPIAGQNWAELVFQGMPGTIQPIQLIQNPDFQFFSPYKLPNYAELYPEGIPNPAAASNEPVDVPYEPPPAYTPTANPSLPQNPSLPGSSVVVPVDSISTPTVERSIVEDSSTSSRISTPMAERTRTPETSEVSNHSSEHLESSELSSEYPGSFTPVHSLQPGDLESTIPVSLTPSSLETNVSCAAITAQETSLPSVLVTSAESSAREIQNCDSSGSLPNSVEEDTLEDLDMPASNETQNETVNSETASISSAADASESR